MRSPKARVVTALVAVVVAVAGCSSSSAGSTGPAGTSNGDPVTVISPKASFTAKTVADWKSLGDAVAVIEIDDSQPDHTAAGDPSENGGTIGRIVEVTVLQVLWQRTPARTPPTRFSMRAWGWINHGNEKVPIVARGEPRFELGHTYLVALAKFSSGWAGLGDGAEAPFDNGTVGVGEWAGKEPDDDQPAIQALLDKNAGQVQSIVDATPADPRSAAYDSLDPLSRAKKLGKATP